MDNCKKSNYRWFVLFSYMLIAAITQLLWINFAAIDTYVEKILNASPMKIGLLTMIFPLTFLILSVESGIIIDRKGYKFSMMLGASFTVIFTVVRIIHPFSYFMLFISQLGISLGQPFILNSISKLSVTCFPKNEEATAIGLGSLSLFIGMIAGLGLTPVLTKHIGFLNMLIVYAIVSAISFGVLYFADRGIKESNEITNTTFAQYINGIRQILRIRDLIILGIVAFIAIGSFNGILTWLEKILSEMHGIPMAKAGSIATALIFSGMVGCFIIPEISDRTHQRKPFLILGLSVASISLLVFAVKTGSIFSDAIVLSIMGFFAISVFPLMLAMGAEITGEKYAGFTTSFLQLLGNGAAVIIVPLINYTRMITGGYNVSIVGISVLFIIAVVLFLFIRERKFVPN